MFYGRICADRRSAVCLAARKYESGQEKKEKVREEEVEDLGLMQPQLVLLLGMPVCEVCRFSLALAMPVYSITSTALGDAAMGDQENANACHRHWPRLLPGYSGKGVVPSHEEFLALCFRAPSRSHSTFHDYTQHDHADKAVKEAFAADAASCGPTLGNGRSAAAGAGVELVDVGTNVDTATPVEVSQARPLDAGEAAIRGKRYCVICNQIKAWGISQMCSSRE